MTIFYFTESQSFPCKFLNIWKYKVYSIKLERKLTSLHNIEVEKMSYFLLNMYAVPDF